MMLGISIKGYVVGLAIEHEEKPYGKVIKLNKDDSDSINVAKLDKYIVNYIERYSPKSATIHYKMPKEVDKNKQWELQSLGIIKNILTKNEIGYIITTTKDLLKKFKVETVNGLRKKLLKQKLFISSESYTEVTKEDWEQVLFALACIRNA